MTSASRPATLSKTMRRVRLEKLWLTKNCQAALRDAAQPALAIDLRDAARQAANGLREERAARLVGTWRLGGLRTGFGGSIEQWGCAAS